MNFFYKWLRFEKFKIQIPFLYNILDIWLLFLMSFGNTFMTSTKSAEVFAKRKMNVKATPLMITFFKRLLYCAFPIRKRNAIIVPVWNCGVAGISWPRYVIFSY